MSQSDALADSQPLSPNQEEQAEAGDQSLVAEPSEERSGSRSLRPLQCCGLLSAISWHPSVALGALLVASGAVLSMLLQSEMSSTKDLPATERQRSINTLWRSYCLLSSLAFSGRRARTLWDGSANESSPISETPFSAR